MPLDRGRRPRLHSQPVAATDPPVSLTLPTTAFVGSGRMAEALVRGLLAAEIISPAGIWLSSRTPERRHQLAAAVGGHSAPSNVAAVDAASLIVIAVKPADVMTVLAEITPAIRPGHLVISVAAGVRLANIETLLPDGTAVVRAMTNAPALVRCGMTAVARGARATDEHAALALRLFGAVGRAVAVPEKYLDAVTALSGSGPAFLAVAAEALADGAVKLGLPRSLAMELVAQTLVGTGQMLLASGGHPALLKDAVASPGGTTIAGLHALERAGGRGAFMDAVVAAGERAATLVRADRDPLDG